MKLLRIIVPNPKKSGVTFSIAEWLDHFYKMAPITMQSTGISIQVQENSQEMNSDLNQSLRKKERQVFMFTFKFS